MFETLSMIGLGYIGLPLAVCAAESGDMPRRDAITIPTASEATAMRSA